MERSERDPSTLPRHIGWFTASCVLVSSVVGTGIFTTTGFMARDLGHPGLILSVWLVGALIALAGALSYSELGAAFPVAGGEYTYLRRAYGPFVGFLSGWTSFTIGFSAAIAAGAVSFAAYFLQLFSLDDERGPLSTALALALLWSITGFHLAGGGAGGALQRSLTVLKVGAIFLFMIAGLMFGTGDWAHLAPTNTQPALTIGSYVVSLIFVLYAYSGWNTAAYLAGEITDPARTIPRTMIGGTLFVALLYLLLNGFYFYALPVTELATPPLLPVADKVARAMLGLEASRFVTAILCLSIAGAVSAMVWVGSRVYYAMAQDELIPSVFANISGRQRAPLNAILLQSLWASALILSGSFEQLVIYSGFALVIFSALAVGAVLILRRREPDLPRPYRTPFYPFIPVFYLVVSIVIVGSVLYERPLEGGVGIATVLAGTPLYLLWRRFRRAEKGGT
ncbi:APC family permease [Nitrosomonas sp. Nm33]|uniref:APC family permease n=1 Tax=Nitrosomonas sp. Nm33 TaxID=133724 RepID=UPI00089B5646|nr:amino acid permease [Nitrosomonas sp. Nm33]SDY19689.1 basic amino acid/polyamine antiporter, APA family [Nitrosomonas sp. Nm33]